MTNNFWLKDEYNKVIYFLTLILIIISLIITLTLSVVNSNYFFLYSILVNIPFLLITPYLNYLFTKSVIGLSKNKTKKKTIITISVILFTLKYLILFIGVFIAIGINLSLNKEIFELTTLIITIFIYPICSMLSAFIYDKRIKKANKIKKI